MSRLATNHKKLLAENKAGHETRIMLREYNEWLLDRGFTDTDIIHELPDDEIDEFINNFSLKQT